ncbi:PASTA domain-containing protein [Deinococcus aquiradiocola]|uniref:PASTA domain-containing protein n=1 Tax=Deinococcus aquiradiocola TaxID=393059 RepID=A0A917UVQ9_9DEIO|nr:PASTA domain-containing protein [Deinococcus aquiradiocola]GGJ88769.1 PASTA domain-containing protein [Deinococcus aquiradiocola]
MTQNADRIDSKYEVLSELARDGHVVLYSVSTPSQPEPLRLAWFQVSSSAQRSSFHRYRSALKALAPAGLLDVVARPGAYYAVWKALEGQPLAAFLALPVRGELEVQGLRDLATGLAEQGFALPDAEVVFPEGSEPQLAYLTPAERTLEEATALNAQVLAPLRRGRLRRRRPVLSVWAVLPGLLFLGGAGYLGAQAARIYLNPPVHEVQKVVGQPAEQAAQKLADSGFLVVYADGEGPGLPVGSVVSQDPPAGSSLPAGRQVTLTVNNPPPLTVPRLDDLSMDQVAVALAENRLTRGPVVTVDGTFTNTPKGRVIAQLPPAGATAQRGDKVTLLVSGGIGSKQTWLPPLTGLSFDDARDLVRRAGLVVNRVTRQNSSARENTVLSQTPAAYTKVDVGSPVTLTVASVAFAGPSQSAGALPLPPPVYVPPPAPVTPDPVTTPADSGVTTDPNSIPATPTTGGTDTTTPSTPATGTPATTPATPAPAATPTRTVRLEYAFPATLPDGTVDIVVRDQDGERTVLSGTPSSSAAGATAQQDGIVVRGDAVFVVRVNGQEFTSFPAR